MYIGFLKAIRSLRKKILVLLAHANAPDNEGRN